MSRGVARFPSQLAAGPAFLAASPPSAAAIAHLPTRDCSSVRTGLGLVPRLPWCLRQVRSAWNVVILLGLGHLVFCGAEFAKVLQHLLLWSFGRSAPHHARAHDRKLPLSPRELWESFGPAAQDAAALRTVTLSDLIDGVGVMRKCTTLNPSCAPCSCCSGAGGSGAGRCRAMNGNTSF